MMKTKNFNVIVGGRFNYSSSTSNWTGGMTSTSGSTSVTTATSWGLSAILNVGNTVLTSPSDHTNTGLCLAFGLKRRELTPTTYTIEEYGQLTHVNSVVTHPKTNADYIQSFTSTVINNTSEDINVKEVCLVGSSCLLLIEEVDLIIRPNQTATFNFTY